jgi:alpha,alpha-trehalose phosphorylase
MRSGTLIRELIWDTPSGRAVAVRSRRLVSFEHRHLLAIAYEVELLDATAPVTVTSLVLNRQDINLTQEPGRPGREDPRRAPTLRHRVLNAQIARADEQRLLLAYQTTNSRMSLAVGVEHVIETSADLQCDARAESDLAELVLSADPAPGAIIRIVKYASYHASRHAPAAELAERAGRALDHACHVGFDALLESQRAQLDASGTPRTCASSSPATAPPARSRRSAGISFRSRRRRGVPKSRACRRRA